MNRLTSKFLGSSLALLISYTTCSEATGQEASKKNDLQPLELFFEGKYEKCIELVPPLLPKLKKPSSAHEKHLLALGGSYHNMSMFQEAQPLLEQHHTLYSEKPFDADLLIAASYFRTANYSRLYDWTRSAELLDDFLKKHPDPEKNTYLPYALFDRANCYYAESEMDSALKMTTSIENRFPKHAIIEQALTLKGNILEGIRKNDDAEKYYLKALAIAEKKKNDLMAAECLFYLTALLGRETVDRKPNPKIEEAIPYYDRFWENYGVDSPYSAKIAVAGIPALRRVGKFDEAMRRFQMIISEMASRPGTLDLEEAIGSYSEEFLKDHSADELKDHFFNSPAAHYSPTHLAILRVAVIAAYQEQLDSGSFKEDEKETKAIIKAYYQDLQRNFKLKDLSNFILMKIGNYYRVEENKPQIAALYYEEILSRKNTTWRRLKVLLILAEAYAAGEEKQKRQAIRLLMKVVNDPGDYADREKASFMMASIHVDLNEHDKAIIIAKTSLSQDDYRRYRNGFQLILGQSYQATGKIDDALAAYQKIIVGASSRIDFSLKAMPLWMEILWKRNKQKGTKSDRQAAYESGSKFIKMTTEAIKKSSTEEKAQWDKIAELVKNYEASPDTLPVGK